MTRSFRAPRFTISGFLSLGVGLAVLAAGQAGAVSSEEGRRFNLVAADKNHGAMREVLAMRVSPNVPVNFGRTVVHTAAEGDDPARAAASKLTDKGGRGKGEKDVKESGASARSSSWLPAVAALEQQMVTVWGRTQLSKYEVTQELWAAVMGTNPSYFKGCAQCPVDRISWDDVQVFLEKLNALTGDRYRLPTEAEWVGAVGSGGGAWHGENSGWRTHPVGQQSPNELGLYDMKGNVWEWVEDCWEGNCSRRVLRGGSWYADPWTLPSTLRGRNVSRYRSISNGFRLARTLAP